MKLKHNILRSLITPLLCTAFAVAFVGLAAAEDAKVDGTWGWTMQGRNGGPDRKITLKLKTEGPKLTGKLITPGRNGGEPRETEIKDGKVKGDEISFSVVREFGGNTMTSKYNGKVAGDTIKGKVEFDRNGQPTSRDWEAKRQTEEKK